MTTRFSFDTNVLLYAADPAAGTRHQTAKALLSRSAADGLGTVTDQSLIEFMNVAIRKVGVAPPGVMLLADTWMQSFELLLPNSQVVHHTFALFARHQLSIWDARLLSVCAANKCSVLLTEDMQDGATYDAVRIVNPFDTTNSNAVDSLFKP